MSRFSLLLALIIAGGGAGIIYLWAQADKADEAASRQEFLERIDTPPPDMATVKDIVDAFTIELDSGHFVRYMGVRTPSAGQEVQCFGKEALKANESVIGQQVRLEEEPLLVRASDGAWLRYVWLIQGEVDPSPALEEESEDEDDIFINERILEGGFGFPVVAEGMTYGDRMLAAARYGRATRKGLWARCEVENVESGLPQTKAIDECVIKGKVEPTLGQTYHTAECPLYGDVGVIEEHGDRWFCSEDEAEEAGFTKAQECLTEF